LDILGAKFIIELSSSELDDNELRSAMYVLEKSTEAALDHLLRIQQIVEDSQKLI